MDLLTALKILVRQWPVVVAGLVLTVVGVIQVGSMVAPSYEAKGTVLLLSPGANANPYLDFGPNLEVAADALMVVLQSPVGAEKLEAAGATGAFKLERVSGPLIDITATAASEDEATTTVELVVAGLQTELETAQATAAAEQRITLNELTQPVPEAKLGSRIRAQAAVGALGLVCTVAAGLTVDAIRRQRREARARREADDRGDDELQQPLFPQAVSVPANGRTVGNGSYRAPPRSAAPPRSPAPTPGRTAAPARSGAPNGNGNGAGGSGAGNGAGAGRNGRTSVYPAAARPPVAPPARRGRSIADDPRRDGADPTRR